VSAMGGDLSSGSTMTVKGMAKEVDVYLSPTGSDGEGLTLAAAELAALASDEALGLVDGPDPAHAAAPMMISSTEAAAGIRPLILTDGITRPS